MSKIHLNLVLALMLVVGSVAFLTGDLMGSWEARDSFKPEPIPFTGCCLKGTLP